MDYLYPKDIELHPEPTMPRLKVPLKVGIAFVPATQSYQRGANLWSGPMDAIKFPESTKTKILNRVAENFRALEFVDKIEVIPSTYLTPGGGFTNLSQIGTMYNVDVVALVSYDQMQFTDDTALSLSYLTIVGAYTISGSKNDTNTLIDTVVFDIDSKKMLFRAPGTSQVKGRATPINLNEELRADSLKSFNEAADEMIVNLDEQLTLFKDRIKNNPEEVQVEYRPGYSGGGSTAISTLIVLLTISLYRRRSAIS
jgi:rhombotail lipoprotein